MCENLVALRRVPVVPTPYMRLFKLLKLNEIGVIHPPSSITVVRLILLEVVSSIGIALYIFFCSVSGGDDSEYRVVKTL